MEIKRLTTLALLLGSVVLAACATPAPTATSTTTPMAAAPTPTKAPTATPTKRPLTKISVASSSYSSLNFAVPVLGKGKGFFLEEGLDIDWIVTGSGAKALAAVVGRSTHVAMVASSDIVSAAAQGQPARAFALSNIGRDHFIVIRKEIAQQRGITPQMTLAQKGEAVKGLKFAATSPGSGSDQMLRYFLLNAGLDPERDVEITYVATTAMAAAFEAGVVDGVDSTQPDTTLDPIRRGKAVMLINYSAGDIPGVGDILGQAAAGHRDEMKAQPEIFEAFTRGLWRAEKLIVQNPKEAKEVVRKTEMADMDEQFFEEYWNSVSKGFAQSPDITEKAFQATVEFRSKAEGGGPLTASFSDFYDPTFVEAAKKQLGY